MSHVKGITAIIMAALLCLRFCGGAENLAAYFSKTGTTRVMAEQIRQETEGNTMKIQAGTVTFTAEFADNSSAEAMKKLLAQSPLTIEMSDYGNFEKVGPIGTSLPRNDEYITTEPGDIILYQGNSLTIYYDTNSWNFTRIAKIQNAAQAELKAALGSGDVTVTLSLE